MQPPSTHQPLPRRPWARDDVPLVWCLDDGIEMGWPPRQVRVVGLDHDHVTWLLALSGDRGLDQALQDGRAAGLTMTTMRRLLRAATWIGLLDDAAQMPASLRGADLVARDRIAGELAAARYLHGLDAPGIIDGRQETEVAVHGDNELAETVALVLTGAGIGSVVWADTTRSTSRRHRQSAASRACHVLCGTGHPDAASDPEAMALDIPHLAVSASGTRAVIGPLVIPGRTSCLRCRDLHLADADPTWARVAVQWPSRGSGAMSAGLTQLAGSWAALQVIALVDAGPERVTAPTIDGAILVTLPDAHATVESRPAHPLCGCRWPRTGRGISA